MADTKRDYYEVLGVEKNATAEEIKLFNIIPTKIPAIKRRKRNSRRQQKHTMC